MRPTRTATPTAEPLDSDLSTVSLAADKLFRLHGPAGLIHLELQSGWDGGLPDRLLLYNVQAEDRYAGPVRSVVLLLRPEARATSLTGLLQRSADGGVYLEFRYTVVRLWELSAEELLRGPVGLLPLAPLTDDAASSLPEVVARMNERLGREVADERIPTMRAAAFILMGLRYEKTLAIDLFREVMTMKESSTYQYILAEGRAEGERRIVRLLGARHFGAPSQGAASTLESITDTDRLERIAARYQEAADWDDLLATP